MELNKLVKKTKKVLKKWGVTDEEADEFIKDLASEPDDEPLDDEQEVETDEKDVEQDVDVETEKPDVDETDEVPTDETEVETPLEETPNDEAPLEEQPQEEVPNEELPQEETPIDESQNESLDAFKQKIAELEQRIAELESHNGKDVKEVDEGTQTELDRVTALYSN